VPNGYEGMYGRLVVINDSTVPPNSGNNSLGIGRYLAEPDNYMNFIDTITHFLSIVSANYSLFPTPHLNLTIEDSVIPYPTVRIQLIIHQSQLTHLIGKEINSISFRTPQYYAVGLSNLPEVNHIDTQALPFYDFTVDSFSISLAQAVRGDSVMYVEKNYDTITTSVISVHSPYSAYFYQRVYTINSKFSDNIIGPPTVVRNSAPLTIEAYSYPAGTEFGKMIHFDTPYLYTGGHLAVDITSKRADQTYVLSQMANYLPLDVVTNNIKGSSLNYNPIYEPKPPATTLLGDNDTLLGSKIMSNHFYQCFRGLNRDSQTIPYYQHGRLLQYMGVPHVKDGELISLSPTRINVNEVGANFPIIRLSSCGGSPAVFDPVSPICQGQTFELPTVSTNGVAGRWTPEFNNQATTTYTFTPKIGECDLTPFTMTVEVVPYVATPTFTQLGAVCPGSTIVLPTISNNGISGTWSPAPNNQQTTTYMFTPSVSMCATTATMTVPIMNDPVPQFTQVDPICVNDMFVLPAVSENGFSGVWTPALNNQTTTTYTFTPDANQCATQSTTMTVAVLAGTGPTPVFDPVASICAGDFLSLPTVSNNGVSGSWNPTPNSTQTTTYTFVPSSGQCANTASMTVTVHPKVMPVFVPLAPVCVGDNLTLPSTSLNNISGTWYPAPNNQQTTTYIFVPDASACVVPLPPMMTVEVKPSLTPTFAIETTLCQGVDTENLPSSSLEGVDGTWTPSTISKWESGTYVFTPNIGQCAQPTQISTTVQPNTVSQPTGESIQEFDWGQTISQLTVEGTNLVWYADPQLTYELFPFQPLVNGTTYYVVSDDGACQSEPLAITAKSATGGSGGTGGPIDVNVINLGIDSEEWHNFSYSPNPVENILTLRSDQPIERVWVSNVLGQTVFVPISDDNTSVDFSEVPFALYIVSVRIQGVEKTFKIVK